MFDSLGAFVPNGNMTFEGAAQGPLKGYGFAVKDIFDLEGYVTGYGNPDWTTRRRPSKAHARVVQDLLDAGAMVVGKTITDEFAYSLNGQNMHYGTPSNPEAPGRIPGGSSSGSASAVAGGLVDFALGSDTGGSIRVPGSYCGLFGIRTTHDRVSREGVLPLAASFDTVGWFARDAWLLRLVGEVVFKQKVEEAPKAERLLIATDAFDYVEPEARQAYQPWLERLEQRLGKAEYVALGDLSSLMETFRTIQAHEIWAAYGAWIERVQPKVAPDIQERFNWAKTVPEAQAEAAREVRDHFAEKITALLAPGTVLCLPSAPGIAPRINEDPEIFAAHRGRTLGLTAPAGLSGCPQITLPLATVQGCPLGLSLMGTRDSDMTLMAFAESFCGGEPEAGQAFTPF